MNTRYARGVLALIIFSGAVCQAQDPVQLAMDDRCVEAMPLLDRIMRDPSAAQDRKRTVSFAGVRCSMLLNQQPDAMSFLSWLQQAYPKDPDVLFLAVHAFEDLRNRNAEELMKTAPDSPVVVQLNAENFERIGQTGQAIAEYEVLLKRLPDKPGIHYKIGALLLDQAGPDAGKMAQKEFEAELNINSKNAGAEFYLGEIARNAAQWNAAVDHYSRALTLYPGFGEASFGLGRSLMDIGKTEEAVAPLENSEKLLPDNPSVHLALAIAYQRLGRKQDATREYALQKTSAEQLNRNMKTLKQNVAGANVPQP